MKSSIINFLVQFNLFFAVVLARTNGDGIRGLRQLGMAEKWQVMDPVLTYDETNDVFLLDFKVNEWIENDLATGAINAVLYDKNCQQNDNTPPLVSDALIPTLGTLDTTADDQGQKGISVDVALITENIAADDRIYQESRQNSGKVVGQVDFCVRFSLTSGPTNIEINFLETLVTFTVDLTGDFKVENIVVEPLDKDEANANIDYDCEGFICDTSNQPSTTETMSQGSVVRICVRPNMNARNDGVTMKRIDSFAFKRDDIAGVTQTAIESGASASNGLTLLDCSPGDQVCSFETILIASFYQNAGKTSGTGMCTMQLGGNDGSGGTDGNDSTEEPVDYTCPPILPPTETHTISSSPFEASNTESTTFNGDNIEFETIIGSDAIVMSKKPHVGLGPNNEIELTVHIDDRDATAPAYQQQLVLFFAPETVSIQDLITNDFQFPYYFEPALVSWMKAKIHLTLQYTWFYAKALDPFGVLEEQNQIEDTRMLSTSALRLRRSNGAIQSLYSFDGGETWTQIGNDMELPDQYKTGPLNVGYRILREYECDFRFVTTPQLVSGGETTATAIASPMSSFDGTNAENAFTSCDSTGCTLSGGTFDQAALLSTNSFSGDFNFTVKIENRQFFGTGYQSGLSLFLAESDKTLQDFTSRSDDDAKANTVARFLDKIHFDCCWHTWTYKSTLTEDGVVDDREEEFYKNLDGYLRIQRINGQVITYLSTNGIGWRQMGDSQVLPSSLSQSPLKVGLRVHRNYAPGYNIKVLPTIEMAQGTVRRRMQNEGEDRIILSKKNFMSRRRRVQEEASSPFEMTFDVQRDSFIFNGASSSPHTFGQRTLISSAISIALYIGLS